MSNTGNLVLQHNDEPLFTPEMDDFTERVWEANNLYDRYGVDTAILGVASSLSSRSSSYRYHRGERSEEDLEHERRISLAKKLLPIRYKELTGLDRPPSDGTDYDGHAEYRMVCEVRDEWRRRYFNPRTEKVDVDVYDDWAEAHLTYAPGATDHVVTQISPPYHQFYRALAPVELVPLHGSAAKKIIAPPGIAITGILGHSEVFSWDEVTEVKPYERIEVYPSTQERIIDGSVLPPAPDMDEIELGLR